MKDDEMITCRVNGVDRTWIAGTTVNDVVISLDPSPRGIAVPRDGEIVPRSSWTSEQIGEGDLVEILTATPGG